MKEKWIWKNNITWNKQKIEQEYQREPMKYTFYNNASFKLYLIILVHIVYF